MGELELGLDSLEAARSAADGLVRGWGDDLSEPMAALRAYAHVQAAAELAIVQIVSGLPAVGRDWDRIGRAIGVMPEQARAQYAPDGMQG